MNLNTHNLSFILQNNPEYVIVEIIEEINRTANQITRLDNEINMLKFSLSEVTKKLEYEIWYNDVNWFRRMWWKIKGYEDNELLKIFKKEHERV